MDTRLTTTHGIWWLLIAASVALALVMAVGVTWASAASPKACRVQNTDTGKTYGALKAAVDAASKGDRLMVRGTCHGSTLIDRNLVVEGKRTKRSGRPTLDGDGQVTPLVVKRTRPGKSRWSKRIPHVTIRGLTIEDGRARPSAIIGGADRGEAGGGIWNDGDLTLVDVVVRGSRATEYGGGIYSEIVGLRLKGSTRVEGNRSGGYGGGVFCWYGRVILDDASSIVGNRARDGAGVACWGPLTMNDASSIVGNRARRDGGGAFLSNTSLELNDAASIRDNRADGSGAGIYHASFIDDENSYPSGITLTGTSSIIGNRAGSADSCCEPGCGGRPSRGGGLWAGSASVVTMTGSSLISGNDATCGGGGLYSEVDAGVGGALSGVSCAPETPANVYGNTPDDCYLEPQ